MTETVDQLIERARPTSGPNAHSFPDDWARYERMALVQLKHLGVQRLDEVLTFGANADPKTRYTAWLLESCVWTIGRVREGRNDEAIRGLLQMSDYCGRIGGFWPTGLDDAFTALRNHFERALRGWDQHD
jgi:hypothetical protein